MEFINDLLGFLRSYRFGPISIFDTVGSFALVYLFGPWLTRLFRKLRVEIPQSSWYWLVIPIGEIVHFLFGISTPLMRMLQNRDGDYLAKFVVFAMIVLGLRKISGRK